MSILDNAGHDPAQQPPRSDEPWISPTPTAREARVREIVKIMQQFRNDRMRHFVNNPPASNDPPLHLSQEAEARAIASLPASPPGEGVVEALRGKIRAIELAVDSLNMKGLTPRPAEKEALNRIKAHCREALSDKGGRS